MARTSVFGLAQLELAYRVSTLRHRAITNLRHRCDRTAFAASISHRPGTARARTCTFAGGGVGSPLDGERHQ
eukprot:1921055-Prymnesium_polylepis.1